VRIRDKFFLACLAVGYFVPTLKAHAWQHEYLQATNAGEISTCNATQSYSDGFITIRLYGEAMDIVFSRNDFTLPYDSFLGVVILDFGSDSVGVAASTLPKSGYHTLPTAQTIYSTPLKEDYARLFDLLSYSQTLKVVFPNGSFYELNLSGSASALSLASNCWSNKVTGPLNNNPFEGTPEGGNPFNTNTTPPQPEADL
jgi:hypothetical protein